MRPMPAHRPPEVHRRAGFPGSGAGALLAAAVWWVLLLLLSAVAWLMGRASVSP